MESRVERQIRIIRTIRSQKPSFAVLKTILNSKAVSYHFINYLLSVTPPENRVIIITLFFVANSAGILHNRKQALQTPHYQNNKKKRAVFHILFPSPTTCAVQWKMISSADGKNFVRSRNHFPPQFRRRPPAFQTSKIGRKPSDKLHQLLKSSVFPSKNIFRHPKNPPFPHPPHTISSKKADKNREREMLKTRVHIMALLTPDSR